MKLGASGRNQRLQACWKIKGGPPGKLLEGKKGEVFCLKGGKKSKERLEKEGSKRKRKKKEKRRRFQKRKKRNIRGF